MRTEFLKKSLIILIMIFSISIAANPLEGRTEEEKQRFNETSNDYYYDEEGNLEGIIYSRRGFADYRSDFFMGPNIEYYKSGKVKRIFLKNSYHGEQINFHNAYGTNAYDIIRNHYNDEDNMYYDMNNSTDVVEFYENGMVKREFFLANEDQAIEVLYRENGTIKEKHFTSSISGSRDSDIIYDEDEFGIGYSYGGGLKFISYYLRHKTIYTDAFYEDNNNIERQIRKTVYDSEGNIIKVIEYIPDPKDKDINYTLTREYENEFPGEKIIKEYVFDNNGKEHDVKDFADDWFGSYKIERDK